MLAFVIASRRSCSRSRAESRLSTSPCTRGSRLCISPLLPSLFRAPASVSTPARVFQRSRRARRWVPTSARVFRRSRRARLPGDRGRVRLATFASASTFGSRRRLFTLCGRTHDRLAATMNPSTSCEHPSTFTSVSTIVRPLSELHVRAHLHAGGSQPSCDSRPQSLPSAHSHGLASYVSRFRWNVVGSPFCSGVRAVPPRLHAPCTALRRFTEPRLRGSQEPRLRGSQERAAVQRSRSVHISSVKIRRPRSRFAARS